MLTTGKNSSSGLLTDNLLGPCPSSISPHISNFAITFRAGTNRSARAGTNRSALAFRNFTPPAISLELGRITQLNSESVRVFHMEALRSLFVGLWSNTSRLQVADDRLPVELINPEAKVVHVSGRLLLSKREMARAYP